MMKTASLATLAAGLLATAASADRITFDYWYGLTGDLGAEVLATCTRFNESQDVYQINCVGQDSYDQAVQNTIAAFRANQHPVLVQSFDAGTADLMLSGEFYPVHQMMADFEIEIDWDDYFPGIANYYAASTGEFISMPFNSSTPVYYWNIDHFEAAGLTEAPLTWEGMEAAFIALRDAGFDCPMAYSPSTWIDLEQFSMVHNIPVASNNNGYDGLDTELLFNTTLHVRHMEDIQRWLNEGLLQMRTAAMGLNAMDSFASGECSIFFGSIASHNTVHRIAADDLNWHVQMLPIYEGFERTNTVVGGASNWVLSGKTEDEYRGAAAYLAFLATPQEQRNFIEFTGYIPVTQSAYAELLETGFYDEPPFFGREIAMHSLTYTDPTELTRGIRLGGFIQIRAEWVSEVEAALSGQKSMQEALDAAVERGNAILARFARTYAGQTFP
ncbi:MAG: extracellular solute-binding protein [Rubellimicrobium sp.]|nr:extracellular solute-binding protein [Rubellimicrobium sp.]